ncbi:sulfate adenylyltransferase subunit CysN [Granulicella sp. dw_53]|uniref:sulfate adenylyltransferase subunit CysN n=1 Tax=Granulicella sp. dw_53 TaxID=2719792 RepID=UPI001BD61470|nr:sulfate adenylyltransferase subunit CysN [Granulicella sp. dw_53]
MSTLAPIPPTSLVLEEDADFLIDEFLAVEQQKDLLRFSTAGSVDDGKSTLIGRLLYDSRNVYEDQVRAVTGTTIAPGQKQPAIDFAQLTDGLRAEREQGITIDVAYRFFSTQRRKFIIADTPGHEQYTRNMATGASTADLAIILIDARKGILTQSRRHAYIASLLGIRHLVAAINKMDLVDFSEDVYNTIASDLRDLVGQLGNANLVTIPVSALDGDNVVESSVRMPWYTGPTLLEHLEEVPVWTEEATAPFRLPVQRVIRPDQFYRGFAGQIAAGTVRRGDTIVALPSGRTSRVASITTFDGDLEQASAPLSIALTLEDELDISRGDVISIASAPPQHSTAIEASLVWFDGDRLETHRPYLLKHGTQTVSARVTRVIHRTNIQTLQEEAVNSLGMNDIGVVEIESTRALFFDPYAENRATGSFILIDAQTNHTAAAGMIRRPLAAASVTPTHKPALLVVPNPEQAAAVESALLSQSHPVVKTRVQSESILRSLLSIGLLVILEETPVEQFAGLELHTLDSAEPNAVEGFLSHLRATEVLPAHQENQP